MDLRDLQQRFKHHPPRTPVVADQHHAVRTACLGLAEALNGLLPEGREKSLAITNLEQVMFWANAAIARTADAERPDQG